MPLFAQPETLRPSCPPSLLNVTSSSPANSATSVFQKRPELVHFPEAREPLGRASLSAPPGPPWSWHRLPAGAPPPSSPFLAAASPPAPPVTHHPSVPVLCPNLPATQSDVPTAPSAHGPLTISCPRQASLSPWRHLQHTPAQGSLRAASCWVLSHLLGPLFQCHCPHEACGVVFGICPCPRVLL